MHDQITHHPPAMTEAQMTSPEPLPMPCADTWSAQYWMMEVPATKASAVRGTHSGPPSTAWGASSTALVKPCGMSHGDTMTEHENVCLAQDTTLIW